MKNVKSSEMSADRISNLRKIIGQLRAAQKNTDDIYHRLYLHNMILEIIKKNPEVLDGITDIEQLA